MSIDSFETIFHDVGDKVFCDAACGEEYTDSKEKGGFYVSSIGAVCPKCAPRVLQNIKKYHEEKYIRDHCPPNETFANWVRSLR